MRVLAVRLTARRAGVARRIRKANPIPGARDERRCW
jgi:hypothetical protein